MRSYTSTECGSLVVFFGGISAHSSREDFKNCVEKAFGPISFMEMPLFPKSKLCKGFAKVCFSRKKDGLAALASQSILVDGFLVTIKKWVCPSKYQKTQERQLERKIYVRFPNSISEEILYHHFSQFGKIETMEMKVDMFSSCLRNFCFITFKSRENVLSATALSIHMIDFKTIKCKPAVSRSKMEEVKFMNSGAKAPLESTITQNLEEADCALLAAPGIFHGDSPENKEQKGVNAALHVKKPERFESTCFVITNKLEAEPSKHRAFQTPKNMIEFKKPATNHVSMNPRPNISLGLAHDQIIRLKDLHSGDPSLSKVWLALRHTALVEENHNESRLRFRKGQMIVAHHRLT